MTEIISERFWPVNSGLTKMQPPRYGVNFTLVDSSHQEHSTGENFNRKQGIISRVIEKRASGW